MNLKWELYDQNKEPHGMFDWVILSLPAEQSLDLISDKTSFYPNVKKIKMKGCYSLMVGMDKSLQLDFDAAFVENKDIAWLALNNSKPSRMKNHFAGAFWKAVTSLHECREYLASLNC